MRMSNTFEVFMTVCLLSAGVVCAQDGSTSLWRCGDEYTHQPKNGQVCAKVQAPADVVTTGPRKFHAVPANASAPQPLPLMLDGPRLDDGSAHNRDPHTAPYLNEQLTKLLKRCQKFPAQSTELVRCQAEEAALRRELARLP